jgi:hypothetical protein
MMPQSLQSFFHSLYSHLQYSHLHSFSKGLEHFERVIARDAVPLIPFLLIAILIITRFWRWRYEYWLGLAWISQTYRCIGAENLRKMLCCNSFSEVQESPDADRVYAEAV